MKKIQSKPKIKKKKNPKTPNTYNSSKRLYHEKKLNHVLKYCTSGKSGIISYKKRRVCGMASIFCAGICRREEIVEFGYEFQYIKSWKCNFESKEIRERWIWFDSIRLDHEAQTTNNEIIQFQRRTGKMKRECWRA